MSTEIIEAPQRDLTAPVDQVPANSPMGMMMAAMKQGATLDQVEQMMNLQQRWEEREAEKAFNDALAAFKSEAVEIIKRKAVDFTGKNGRTHYKHAELSDVVEAVGPALSKHGFAWSWKTHQEKDLIRVTCILKHRQGHTDSVSLEANADQSGSKNNIQAIASTVTYLQRHTLKAITGVSEKGDDDDGLGSANSKISADLRDEWISEVAKAETLERLETIWQEGGNIIYATNNLADYNAFKKAVSDKKKMLTEAQ
ncbi:ERF family protein [Alcaligenes aquatilis]|uniref:ERF family protein n=1 Tax=Alcaligenes aquatilis TaxID=323284 RepID=UPI000F68C2DB|nr:ERF family protein [Alcaligenes aquatilis]QXR37261.1 ERF family protein [Alcaligenes aquatilis]